MIGFGFWFTLLSSVESRRGVSGSFYKTASDESAGIRMTGTSIVSVVPSDSFCCDQQDSACKQTEIACGRSSGSSAAGDPAG